MRTDKNIGWTGKSYGGYWGNKIFAMLLRVGMYPAYFLLVFVSAYYMVFRRGACAGGAKYLGRLFARKIRTVSIETYGLIFSFGISILDRVAYFAAKGKITCVDDCEDTVKKLIAGGGGLVVLTSHIGGWQIAGAQLSKYGRDVGIVGLANEDAKVERVFEEEKAVSDLKILGGSGDTFGMLPAYSSLRRGGIIAMHGDRYAGGRFAETDFLGQNVRAPLGAYILAAKAGVPVAQIFCVREKLFSYRMEIADVFHFKESDGDVEKYAEACAAKFFKNTEKVLKKHPFQWFNFYDFWA